VTIVRPASGWDNGRLVPRYPLLSIKLCKINELQHTVDPVERARIDPRRVALPLLS
jgi:hypothetical protein